MFSLFKSKDSGDVQEMIELGRVCIKIAGREAMKKCVVVKVLDENFVLIDGQVKRRKCNISHLEPLQEKLDINENASTEEVKKALAGLKVEVKEKKTKAKKEKPVKKRVVKEKKPRKKASKK